MKRVALLSGPVLGHAARDFLIAEALCESGAFNVTFVTPLQSAHLERLCDGRHEIVNLQATPGEGRPSWAAMADALDDLFDARTFDVVVHDLCPVQWLSAARFPDCPRVNVTNVFLTRYGRAETFQTERFRSEGDAINALRRARGLSRVEDVFDFYDADLVLLTDPRVLAERLGELAPNHLVCGPISLRETSPLPEALVGLDRVLLISMGSTGVHGVPTGMLAAIRDATGSASVVYVGGNADRFRPDPAIDFAFDWLPIEPLLHRTRAVVTHGGSGSTYQALTHGRPVLVLPDHRNQALLGELLEAQGAGCLLGQDTWRDKVSRADFAVMQMRAADFIPGAGDEDSAKLAARAIAEIPV